MKSLYLLLFIIFASIAEADDLLLQKVTSSSTFPTPLKIQIEANKILGTDDDGLITFIDPPSASWGNISGSIESQTDLAEALAGKQDILTASTGVTISGGAINIGQSVGTTDTVTFGGIYSSGIVSASEAYFGSVLSVGSGAVHLTGTTYASDLQIYKAVIDASDGNKVFRVNSSGSYLPIELNGVYAGNSVGIKFLSQNIQAGVIQYNPSSGLSILSFPRLNLLTSDDAAKTYLVQSTNARATARVMLGRQTSSNSSSDLIGYELIGASTGTISPGHGIRYEWTLNKGGSGNTGVLAAYDAVRWVTTTSGSETAKRIFAIRASGATVEPVEINGDGIVIPDIPESASGLPTGQLYVDPMSRQVYAAP